MKYRKKPVEVEAVQFTGTNEVEIKLTFLSIELFESSYNSIGSSPPDHLIGKKEFYIKTLEGVMKINDGDWIIKGIAGEFYPCKNDIFEKTYEKVEEWEQKTRQYLNETGKDRL